MAGEKSDFGLIGRAWNTSKIYSNSSIVRNFDAIVNSDSIRKLGSYMMDIKNAGDTRGISLDTKVDERLQRYNIVKITPTRKLGETENPLEMYLITDENGHDIGIYEVGEDGPKFRLAPKIKDHNDKIMEKFQGEGEQEILKEHYEVRTLEDLTDKLAKGENLVLDDEEQAKETIKEEYEKNGMPAVEGDDNLSDKERQEQKEKLDKIPADMRAEALDFAQQEDISLKEILIVDNPEQVANTIDNRENQISETGGPVILMRASHRGADGINDDVYALQDGKPAKQDERNDRILENIMERHEDVGHIDDLDKEEQADNAQKMALDSEVERIYREAQGKIEAEEDEIAQIKYNKENFSADNPENASELEEKLDEEVSEHEKNIEDIVVNRDAKIKDLLGRASKEKGVESPARKEEDAYPRPPETPGERTIYDRPTNPHNN